MTTSIIARVNDVDILLFKGEKELIPIKPICMALGIDFASQFQKIVIHPILRNVVYKEYMVGADNKKRKMICMPLAHILIWLLSICYKNVNKDAIKPLLTTQMTLYYILYKRIQMSNSLKVNIEREAELLKEIELLYKERRKVDAQIKVLEENFIKMNMKTENYE